MKAQARSTFSSRAEVWLFIWIRVNRTVQDFNRPSTALFPNLGDDHAAAFLFPLCSLHARLVQKSLERRQRACLKSGGDSEETVHRPEPKLRVPLAPAVWRNRELAQQPDCSWSHCACQAMNQYASLSFSEAIQEKVGDHA